MSYRQAISEEIRTLQPRLLKEEKLLQRVIGRWYARALEEAKRTGGSIESLTYEILEGIEDGFAEHPEKIESVLPVASHVMTDLLEHSIKEDILRHQRKVAFAQKALEEVKQTQQLHLQASFETLKEYAKEHHYTLFEEHLHQMMENMRKA